MNRWDETANDIFLDAVEIPDEQVRARFLDEKCGQDESLKRKVGSLIVASQQAGDFLNEPLDPIEVDQATTCHIDLTAGETVGHYKLLQKIGEGGFGIVYMAEQKQPVRRKVALKIIKPGMDTREVIARFEAERQAVAMMDHPNIAKVFDAGTTDAGRPYFVMELVKGVPITQFCDENQLSTRQRLLLFITVCNAVQHAHQKGVIHRDLKPSNIMVTINDGEPMAKVIDFGVAKAINHDLTDKTLFTLFGQMVGTPQYMSPEQAGISAADLDTRSDIYSLGVLLFELLTGSPPLEEERLRRSAFAEIQRIIREEEAPKPSTRLGTLGNNLSTIACNRKVDPAKLQRDVSGELDWIVMKSLEKDRKRRFETASGFAADIQRYLNDEPVVACPPSTAYRLRKFARRNKTMLATTAIVMIALLAGTIVSTSQAIRAYKEKQAAIESNEAALKSKQAAIESKDAALKSEQQAQNAEQKLRKSSEALRDQLYVASMKGASESFALGDTTGMRRLVDAHKPVSPETDQRGFEWYLWWRAGHLSTGWARNTWHAFNNLAVSPDGKIVATNDYNVGAIHVYDRESMRLICCPLPVGSPHDRLRFSPDGRFLVAAAPRLSPVRIFDTHTWGHSITVDAGPTKAIAFAREQPLLATDGLGQITLWDTKSWQRSDSLPAEDHSLHLALNPAGTKLVRSVSTSPLTGSPLDRIELWDIAERKVIRTLNTYKVNKDDAGTGADHNDEIAFSPDGELLAIGHRDGAVRIWTVTDLFAEGDEPSPAKTYSASNPIESLAFSPDSARIAVGTSQDNAVLVWDITSPDSDPIETIRGHAAGVNGVAFVGDSSTVCSCDWDGYVKTWDLSNCRPYDVIRHVEPQSHAGYSADGRLIYLDTEGAIREWDVTMRDSRGMLDREQTYSHIALSADGSVLAGVTRNEERLRVWNLLDESVLYSSSLEPLRRLTESRNGAPGQRALSRFVVSNDGRLVACLVPQKDSQGHVVLVKSENGEIMGDAHELAYVEGWPAFSPSGQQIVTQGYMDPFSRLSIIKAGSLEQRLRIRGGPGIEMCAAFTPDGATLAIGSAGRDVRIHDVASGKLIQVLKGHTEPVTSVTFSRDADRLVSSGRDGTVRIWKRQRDGYQLVSTLRGQSQSIKLAMFAPTSDSLAAVHGDGSIQVWRSASPQEVNLNVDEQLIRAGSYLRTDPVQALRELDDVLPRASADLRALALRGRLHDKLGNWRSAVADWTIAIRLDPENHYYLQSRAKAYALGQRWKQAESDWNRLVQLTDQANGEYLLGRGECYLHMGRRGDARADLMKALTQTASVESVERILSLLRFVELLVPTGSQWRYATGPRPPGKWESPSFDDSEWLTGWSPFGTGERDLPTRTDWGDHDVWLRHTFELDHVTNTPLVLYLRADEEVEVFINGVSAATIASTVDYTAYKRVYQVAECSSQARLRPGKNVMAVHCQNEDWRTYVDVGLYVQAEPAEIEATLIAASQRAPHNAVLHTALAVRYVEQGNWKDAAIHFHESAKLSPGRDLSWIWAALLYCYSGEPDGFHQLTADMLEQFGETNSPHRAVGLATAYLAEQPAEGNLAGLDKLVDKALTLDSGDDNFHRAQIAKALIEYRKGNDQAAVEWAQKCQALGVLALAHARTGEIELAHKEIAELKQSLEDEPPFYTRIRRNRLRSDEPLAQILLDEVKHMVAEQ